jgi:hypothetical protein
VHRPAGPELIATPKVVACSPLAEPELSPASSYTSRKIGKGGSHRESDGKTHLDEVLRRGMGEAAHSSRPFPTEPCDPSRTLPPFRGEAVSSNFGNAPFAYAENDFRSTAAYRLSRAASFQLP